MKQIFSFFTVLIFLLLLSNNILGQTPVVPTDGSTGVAIGTTDVSWNPFDDGNGSAPLYDAEYSTTGAWAGEEVSLTVVNETGSGIIPAYNQTIYWRVRDNDTDGFGTPGAWNYFDFTYEIGTPSITAPTANLIDVSTTFNFTWGISGSTAGVTFDLEVSDDGFSTVAYSALGLTTLSHTNSTAFAYNVNYEVRVTAKKSGEADKTSTDIAFKTELPNISLTSPSNGASTNNRMPTLSWNTAGAVSDVDYTINITGPNGYNASFNATSPYTFPSNLDYGTYNWSVTIDDNNTPLDNTSKSTATWTFDIYPGLVYPTNTLTGVSIEPEFEWDFDGTSTFTIEISNTNTFATIIASYSGVTDSYNFTENDAGMPLTPGTVYYWRVEVNGVYSPVYAFMTTANVGLTLANPGNGSTVHFYSPYSFTWYLMQAQGNLRFSLQILNSPTPPTQAQWAAEVTNYVNGSPHNFAYFADNISNIYENISGLFGGTSYYWRVVAYYDNGSVANQFDFEDKVAKYSSVWQFNTAGGAVMAYPTWPSGGYTIYDLTPYYYWYTLEYQAGATFTVLVSPTDNGNAVLDDEPIFTSISAGSNYFALQPSNLNEGTTYYWQVVTSYNGNDVYSAIHTFNTYAPSAVVAYVPTPSWPTGGAFVYETSPYLYWYVGAAYNNLLFDVEINTTNVFTGTPTYTGISDLFYQVTGLIPGQTYYWKVRSYENGNPANNSSWSTTATFTVIGGSYSAAVASWPVSNPVVYTNLPTLSWYVNGSVLGWSGFIVKWQANSSPADWAAVPNQAIVSGVYNTWYTFTSALDYGTTYYWAVALYDGVNPPTHADYSEGSFTVAGGSGSAIVVLSAPDDGSVQYMTDVWLYWYLMGNPLGITSYQLEYSQHWNMSFSTVVSGITGTYYNLSGLTPGANYYWRVRGHYSGSNYTAWSSVFSFTVAAGSNPVTPKIGSPNNVMINTASPSLSWYLPVQSSSSLRYTVQISNNVEFNNPQTFDNLEQLNTAVSNLNLGTYYWRVKSNVAGDANNSSVYSSTGKFIVGTPTSNKDGVVELPKSFVVEQNYPNPFNPTTNIRFGIPEAGFVTVKIYNMLGQEIKTLISDNLKEGYHSITWNGDDNFGNIVSGGVYLYKVSSGNNIQVKKMIFLK